MIAWSITYGLQCPGIDRVVVSTDSEEIREVARAYGAEVPFLRPKDLAGPKSMVEGALLHAVEYYEQEENYHPDRIVLLQPTSPLRLADTMDRALAHFDAQHLDTLVSVYENHSFYWRNTKPPHPLYDVVHRPMRQDIAAEDHIFGEVGLYIVERTSTLKAERCRIGGEVGILPVCLIESMEVDTLEDFQLIEALMGMCLSQLVIPRRVAEAS